MLESKSTFTPDEFVVGFRSQTDWGVPVALYFLFSGTGAGLFLFSLFLHSPHGILLDLIFLGIGVFALFLDLGNRWRFWKAFAKPMTSWISRGTFLITILFLFDLIYALIGFPPLPLSISIFFGVIAVMVILYPGIVISYSPSIASWNNPFIPVLFGIHSLTSGLSIGLIFYPLYGDKWKGMVMLQLWLLLFLLISTGIFLLVSYASSVGSRESVRLLLRGRWGISFLLVGTAIGIILPLGLHIILTECLTFWSLIPIVCVLRVVGDFGFRYAILKVGLYEPLI